MPLRGPRWSACGPSQSALSRLFSDHRYRGAVVSAAFTPGPWKVGSDNGYGELRGIQIKEAMQGFVVAVTIADVQQLYLARKDNARLIAAAPELYEAALAAFNFLGGVDGATTLRDQLLYALTKADAA
jgi:hypothetical protein